MGNENWERIGPSEKETKIAGLILISLALTIPIAMVVGLIVIKQGDQKSEAKSLEKAIRSVGTDIVERNDCEEGVRGYYLFEKDGRKVIKDEIGVCTNNFSKTLGNYPNLLKHEMTHIMQACLGTTINSPDEIRELRKELKKENESSYRTIHGAYSESNHFMEVEARWMELQDYKYVNRQLQKYCGYSPLE